MSRLTKAKTRLDRLYDKWRIANRDLHEDRNRFAGEIYEQRLVIDGLIDDHSRAEYAASWAERWPL